jgi:hypothetical protein
VAAILAGTAAALGLLDAPPLEALLWGAAALFALAPVVLVLGAHALSRWLAAGLSEGRLPAVLHAAHAALAARSTQLAAIGLSFVIWLAFGALATLAANAVAVIPPTVALMGASAGNIAFALPVNGIVGLGASQMAWVAVVSQAGVSWADAVISALAVYVVTFVGAILFGGVAMLIPSPPRDPSRA